MGQRVTIGKIFGAHGLKGTLKVVPWVESLDLFEPRAEVKIKRKKDVTQDFVISGVQRRGRVVLVSLEGVEDRDHAEQLVGATLEMDQSRLPTLEEDTYYWSELIGLEVMTTSGDHLGRLSAIVPTGSNDVYVVRGQAGEEVLIPALASVVVAVDLARSLMRVQLPEGL